MHQLREQSIAKWQSHTTKRQATKQIVPVIKDRLTKKKMKLTPKFASIVTAHGKTKAYLHRFKIIESPNCPCNGGEQTVEHLLYDCNKLRRERDKLIRNISNQDKRPVNKSAVMNKHKTLYAVQQTSRDCDSNKQQNNCKNYITLTKVLT